MVNKYAIHRREAFDPDDGGFFAENDAGVGPFDLVLYFQVGWSYMSVAGLTAMRVDSSGTSRMESCLKG